MLNRARLSAIVAAAALTACATSRSAAPPAPAASAPPAPSAPAAAAQAEPRPAPDHSLAPAAYLSRGLPALDRVWSGKDYGAAGEALMAIASSDPLLLPRRGSARSGALFERLASLEDERSSSGLPLEARLADGVPGLQGRAKIMIAYAVAHSKAENGFSAEVVDLTAAATRAARILISQASQVKRPAGAAGDRFDEGREKMTSGYGTMASGVVDLAGEQTIARADRLRLIAFATDELPRGLRYMPPLSRTELAVHARRLAGADPSPEVKQGLEKLAARLEQR